MRSIFKFIVLMLVFLSLQTYLTAVQFEDITVSNLTSSSATISFFSDNIVSANIEYGTDDTDLIAANLSTDKEFHTFQLTGLVSTTLYYFQITSGEVLFKDNGEFYTLQTAQVAIGTPYIVYGTVVDDGGSAVIGAYVKLIAEQNGTSSSPLSAITDTDGKWNLNLGNLKLADTGGVMNYSTGGLLRLSILQVDSGGFTQDFSVIGSSPQVLDLTVGSNSYFLPIGVTEAKLAEILVGFSEQEITDSLSGASDFSAFVASLYGATPSSNQISRLKVAISSIQDRVNPYNLPFAVEMEDLALSLAKTMNELETALASLPPGSNRADLATLLSIDENDLTTAFNDVLRLDYSVATQLLSDIDEDLLVTSLNIHTDENGNTNFDLVAEDLEGIDRIQLKSALATSMAKSTFTLTLVDGLNMISLPNRPDTILTADTLAQQISEVDNDVSVNFVIRLDPASQKFKAFVPSIDDPSSIYNFNIDGGHGYIIKMADAGSIVPRQVSFSGGIWLNLPTSAPSIVTDPNWAFVIDSPTLIQLDGRQPSSYRLIDQRGKIRSDLDWSDSYVRWRGQVDQSGRLRIALVDQSRKSVIKAGDQLQLEIFDQREQLLAFSSLNITEREIESGLVQVDLRLNPIPTATRLLPNYPNPFNPETWIPFQLHQHSAVSIQIFDADGAQVKRLELGHLPAGLYHTTDRAAYWNGQNHIGERVASGTYFYQLNLDNYQQTRKMVILK